jgi:hypothetical protein
MFAWLLSPETIPKEYSTWYVGLSFIKPISNLYAEAFDRILSASQVPEFAVLANRTAVRQRLIDPVQVQRALNFRVSR